MPKPMLRTPDLKLQADNLLKTTNTNKAKEEVKEIEKMQLDRLLRKSRSKEYMEALYKLDAGGHVHNEKQVEELMNVLRKEFPEVEIKEHLLGIVSKCYLGDSYEVHVLDLLGSIVDHYRSGEPLPNGLEKARALAIRGGYSFIEVYATCCRCISSSGAVSVVAC